MDKLARRRPDNGIVMRSRDDVTTPSHVDRSKIASRTYERLRARHEHGHDLDWLMAEPAVRGLCVPRPRDT
jgi:hypothetical protein